MKELPADRREALETLRRVMRDSIDKDFEERVQYGNIGFCVPHSIYPAGYHCDGLPLPFAGMASQKNHMSLYLMCTYMDGSMHEDFVKAWKKTGKKLDMGKSCIRFKKIDDVALDVVAQALKKITVKKYIAMYEENLAKTKAGKKVIEKSAKKVAKKTVKKVAKKAAR